MGPVEGPLKECADGHLGPLFTEQVTRIQAEELAKGGAMVDAQGANQAQAGRHKVAALGDGRLRFATLPSAEDPKVACILDVLEALGRAIEGAPAPIFRQDGSRKPLQRSSLTLARRGFGGRPSMANGGTFLGPLQPHCSRSQGAPVGEESKDIGPENADVNGTEKRSTRLHLDHLLAGADGSRTVHVRCSLPYSPAHLCHKRAQTCEALATCLMAQEHGIAATAIQHHKGRSTASRSGAFGAPGGSSPLCNPWPTDLRLRVARGKHLDWSFPEEAKDFSVEEWAVNHINIVCSACHRLILGLGRTCFECGEFHHPWSVVPCPRCGALTCIMCLRLHECSGDGGAAGRLVLPSSLSFLSSDVECATVRSPGSSASLSLSYSSFLSRRRTR